MKYYKLRKIFVLTITCCFIWSCGYQTIFNKDNQKFSISSFTLEGNKRLGGLLRNNLILVKGNDNPITLNIKSKKKTEISNKSQAGKILSYALTLNFEIVANKNNKIIFSKVYTKNQSYSASEVHSDTLKNEKKLVENMIESIANDLLIELNSIDLK